MRKELSIRPATLYDAFRLAGSIRKEDSTEINLLNPDADVSERVVESFLHSEVAFSAWVDDELLCVFGGCRPTLMSEDAVIWELGTDAIRKHSVAFLLASKRAMGMLQSSMPGVTRWWNALPSSYTTYAKWLEKYFGAYTRHMGTRIEFVILNKEVSNV